MRRQKTWFILAAAILALTLMVSACTPPAEQASPSPSPQTAQPPASEQPAEPTPKEHLDLKLTVFTEQATDGFKAMIDAVNANEELAMTINLDVIVGGVEGENLVKVRFASGEYPELLAATNAQWLALNLNEGTNFIDIADEWVNNYPQSSIESAFCSIDGRVVGQPFGGAQTWVMYYNKQVFADLGLEIPGTWAEFLDVCETIKNADAGITPMYLASNTAWTLNVIPQVFGMMDYEGRYSEYSEMYNNFEVKNVDRANYLNGIYQLKEMANRGYINESHLSDTHAMAQDAIIGGQAAMYAGLGSLSTRFFTAYPEQYENIGAFAIPVGNDPEKSYLCLEIGRILTATDKFPDPERAKELFNFLATYEVQLANFAINPDMPVTNLLSSDDIDLPPATKDILNIRNSENVVIEAGIIDLYNSGVDLPTGIQQFLATSNYSPWDLMREKDDGLAKAAE